MPKPIYIFDECECVDWRNGELAIKGLIYRFQSRHAVYFTEVCCICGYTVKVRESLDDLDEIWDLQREAEFFLNSEESKELLQYLDEPPGG